MSRNALPVRREANRQTVMIHFNSLAPTTFCLLTVSMLQRQNNTHTHTKKISPEIRRHESNVHVPLLNRSACVPQSDKSSFKERCQKKELVSFGMSSFFSHWKKKLKNGFMGQSLKLFKCLLWHLFVWVSTVCQFGVLFSRGKWQVSAHHSSKH